MRCKFVACKFFIKWQSYLDRIIILNSYQLCCLTWEIAPEVPCIFLNCSVFSTSPFIFISLKFAPDDYFYDNICISTQNTGSCIENSKWELTNSPLFGSWVAGVKTWLEAPLENFLGLLCFYSVPYETLDHVFRLVMKLCASRVRQARLAFKEGISSDCGLLSSWGYEGSWGDCCRWGGVGWQPDWSYNRAQSQGKPR